METNEQRQISAATSDKFSLNKWYTCGRNDEIILTEKKTGIKTTVITKDGTIARFPEIGRNDFWVKYIGDGSLDPTVRYRFEFNHLDDGRWRVLWTVQPDGRYWEDEDGFGGTSDPEIILYSYLASDGGFTQPFQVYRVGVENYLAREGE